MLIPYGLRIETAEFGWIDTTDTSAESSGKYSKAYGEYFGEIDTDNVDLDRFPKWTSVPWFHAELNAGDCIYMPPGWYHYVESDPAVTVSWHNWFTLSEKWVDDDPCVDPVGVKFSTDTCLYDRDKHGSRMSKSVSSAKGEISSMCVFEKDSSDS